jgi:PiT family inorganic phosphate transporter
MWFFSNLYYFIHFAFALIFSSLNLYQADVAFKKNAINILCHGLGHGGNDSQKSYGNCAAAVAVYIQTNGVAQENTLG